MKTTLNNHSALLLLHNCILQLHCTHLECLGVTSNLVGDDDDCDAVDAGGSRISGGLGRQSSGGQNLGRTTRMKGCSGASHPHCWVVVSTCQVGVA